MKRVDQVLKQKDLEGSDSDDGAEQTSQAKVFHHGHQHHVHRDRMTTIYRPQDHPNEHSQSLAPNEVTSDKLHDATEAVAEREEHAEGVTHPKAVAAHLHIARRSGKVRMLNGRARNAKPIRTSQD